MWVDVSARLLSLYLEPSLRALNLSTLHHIREQAPGSVCWKQVFGLSLTPQVPAPLLLQPRPCVQPEPSPAVECRLLELVWPEASHPSPPPLPFLLESSSRNLDQKESQGLELGSWCKDASCVGQGYLVPVDRARELACLQWAS